MKKKEPLVLWERAPSRATCIAICTIWTETGGGTSVEVYCGLLGMGKSLERHSFYGVALSGD